MRAMRQLIHTGNLGVTNHPIVNALESGGKIAMKQLNYLEEGPAIHSRRVPGNAGTGTGSGRGC